MVKAESIKKIRGWIKDNLKYMKRMAEGMEVVGESPEILEEIAEWEKDNERLRKLIAIIERINVEPR